LESLDLQGAHLTNTAVVALKDLKELRRLSLDSASGKSALTDASVEYLLGMTNNSLEDAGYCPNRERATAPVWAVGTERVDDLHLSNCADVNG
jgi:hypothetical protein